MQLINYTNPKLLIASEGKMIRDKNDVYVPEHTTEAGELVQEHKPYYSSVIFPGSQIDTLEKAMELYIEEVVD